MLALGPIKGYLTHFMVAQTMAGGMALMNRLESTEPDTVVEVRLDECERGCDIQKGCYGGGCGPGEECRPPGGDEMERSISPPWVRAVSVFSRECSGTRLGGCHGSSLGMSPFWTGSGKSVR